MMLFVTSSKNTNTYMVIRYNRVASINGSVECNMNRKARRRKIRLQRIPQALQPGPGTKLGLLGKELLFLLVDLTLAGDEVYSIEGDDFGFEVEFVASPEEDEGRDSDVGGNKGVGLEGDEGVIALEEGDKGGGDEGEVRAPWLKWSFVGQVVAGVALNLESFHESTRERTSVNGLLSEVVKEKPTCVSKRCTSK